LRIAIDWKSLGRDVGILVGVGLFMAFLNPFGSVSETPILTAVTYWVSLILYGGLAGGLLTRGMRKFLPKLPAWGFLGILSVLMSLAVLPAVMAAQAAIMAQPIPNDRLLEFLFYIWLVSLAVSTVFVLGFRAFGARSGMFDPNPLEPHPLAPPARPSAAGAGGPPASAFLDRLPIRLRTAELYAVQSEDHYLRVHTSAGQELILMRIADAIRELGAVDGLQTHRSWWVATGGLADASRQNGRVVLKLKSGVEAPVSRTYLAAVKEKGWA
jgi:hypothetical protein